MYKRVNSHEGGKSVIINHFTYARKILKGITAGIVVIAFLQGCAYYTGMQKKADKQPLTLDVDSRMPYVPDRQEQPLELDVSARMLLVQDEKKQETGPLYRFRAKEMPIVMALDLFARNYDLNIIASPDVTGTVTVDFKDLSLEKSMEVILEAYGYYWSKNGSLIKVYKFETEIFIIDYLRLIREGKGSSQASVASSSGAESGGVTINQSDTISFWEDLETQLKLIVSGEGKVIINRISGTIQITDFHKNVMHVKRFLSSITDIIKRQVEINMKILEVTLDDEFSIGIDWDLIVRRIRSIGVNTATVAASTAITSPFGGTVPKVRTISLGLVGSSDFSTVITALREQGEINVISRPSIRVMNNQPALIKVGTDRPFFNQTTTVGTAGSGNTITEEVEFVTEGLVLSITPQISGDGLIMLDVTPIISRLVETATSNLGSTAPVMDVKQSSTIVRLRDGEMVTIGGLIQDSDTETRRKIPMLGDIPLVGNVFRGNYKIKEKSELVIFITPKIINL